MPVSSLAIVPDFLIAVLAAWLGASVVSRNPRDYPSRPFAILTALLALWGATRVVRALSSAPPVRDTVLSVEAAVAATLPAALLHITLALTTGRRWPPARRAALAVAYAAGLLVGALSVADRAQPIAVTPPYRTLAGLPGPALGWGWIGLRAAIMALAVWWAWRAWRGAPPPRAGGGSPGAVVAAVAAGAVSGTATLLLNALGGPVWVGTTLIAISLGLVAYGVVAQRLLFAPGVARRSLSYSLGAGLLTALYVALLLGLERLSRGALAIETPLVTALALVLTIALFDPVRERARAFLDRDAAQRERVYRRLLRALGDELLTSQRPEAAVGPALERLGRALGTGAAAVIAADGRRVAAYGAELGPASPVPIALPLRAGERECGRLLFGPKRSGAAYSPAETDLLRNAAAFIAASLHLAEHQAAQAAALDALTRERAALRSREVALAEALARAEPAPPAPGEGLRVYALGPLRVERGGERIRQWGGAKAGTRQAEALFAFLYDRAERGVAKDEALEVIWPDVPLDRADLAFHRTLGGLRRTLDPDLKRAGDSTAIVYHNDRYRLDPALIGWSDVARFEERLAAAGALADPAAALAALEEARALYRGDYLDDCPFYGDSEWVEERWGLLRGRFVDLLLALAERHEARGDRPSAAAHFREALAVAGDDCPRADAGLGRLGLPV